MTFSFSNRNQWQIICIELAIVSLISFFSSVILIRIGLMALLFLVLGIVSIVYLIKFYQKHLQEYLVIDDQVIVITSLLSNKKSEIAISMIKKLIHQGNQINIYDSNAQVFTIYLNYLSADDIKTLLMYLKYTPTIMKKII
jgi:hypothetical protein